MTSDRLLLRTLVGDPVAFGFVPNLARGRIGGQIEPRVRRSNAIAPTPGLVGGRSALDPVLIRQNSSSIALHLDTYDLRHLAYPVLIRRDGIILWSKEPHDLWHGGNPTIGRDPSVIATIRCI